MTKKILSIVMLLCLTICMVIMPVSALDVQPVPDDEVRAVDDNLAIYIHDNADKISKSDEEKIVNTILSYNDELDFHLNVLVLTYNDSNGKSAMTYSDDYMDKLFPSSENNIAFVIDYDNDELYLNTMGECILRIDDDEVEDCIDDAWYYFEQYEDAEALEVLAESAMRKLTATEVTGILSMFFHLFHPYSIIAGLIGAIVTTLIINGKHNKNNQPIKTSEYINNNGLKVVDKKEVLTNTYTTKTRIQSSSSSGGSRGGSSHRSSSGRSHGGGGRRR
ncbi:MAG: TPM domain-containing protein [Agathobacter sp.]|nr:TPM domain-containing protein [Agathobacter sp.]